MDCEFFHDNLIAYRENDLPGDARKQIESHLSGCESCRKLLAGWEAVELVIDVAKATEPSPYAAMRIIRYLENHLEQKTAKTALVFRPILVTLAALGAISLGFTIGKSGFDRINRSAEEKNRIETLKSDLYIRDFIEEDNTLLINE